MVAARIVNHLFKEKQMKKRWLGNIGSGMLAVALTIGFMAGNAAAEDFQRYGIRLRGLVVVPTEDVDNRLDALGLEVSNDVTPELDLEYFFLRNLSAELILGVTKHDITANGEHVGSTWLLPPTLTVKFHPLAGSSISPYLGVGVNYVIPFKDKLDLADDFKIDNSLGWAAQVGADLALGNSWYANVDIKYLNVETEMRVAGTKYDLDLNPIVAGLGVGYRF